MRFPLYASMILLFVAGCGVSHVRRDGGDPLDDGDGGAADDLGQGALTDANLALDDLSQAPTDLATTPIDIATAPVFYIYAQSATTLYKVDPVTRAMTTVADFNGCDSEVIDIAVDANTNGYATTYGGVYHLNLKTAACTLIRLGNYPNSLSFVPKGTLDPNEEALVGYEAATYVRIDTTTGALTNVGGLTGGYMSSGDIVSVTGGGTFLTVTGGNELCNDCLLQVNPKTGDMVQNYGSVNHSMVYGLAYWAGTAYGFDDAGDLFAISWQNNKLTTTDVPTTPGLSFYGAGSSTSAPPTGMGGNGPPIM